METLIVTGGAGFIGSNFVHLALAERAHRVVVFDKLTYAGRLENLGPVESDPRFRFVRGDIADRDEVRQLLREEQPTALLNFAAESHVDRSIDDPASFVRTNVTGTFELLEASRHYLGEATADLRHRFRFVHVSTDEVFGSLDETGAFSETTPYAPNSPYAASKAAADHLVRAYFHTYGLPTVLTNCSNNFGPYQLPEKLIPLMILNARDGRDLPLYGDGSNVRDWLHVEDHCRALLCALEQGQPGESYNVGANQERTNLEIVHAICACLEEFRPAQENEALRRRGTRSYRDLLTFVTDRPGHDRRYAIDSSKIRRQLGWQPRHDFEHSLRDTVRWYLDNRDWCEAVSSSARRQRLGLGVPS